MPRVWRVALAASVLAGTAVAGAPAQTPVSSLGLGVPVPSLDARSAALGGVALGLPEGSVSARNPADIALFGQPVLGITYAPEGVSVEGSGESVDTGRSRVAVLRGAIPFDDWALGVAFAAELDQDWQVSFQDTLHAEDGTYPFTEQRTQDGGLSSVNFTLARRLGRITVGAEYAIMTGRLQQSFRRDFGPDVDDPSRLPNAAGGRADWDYGGSRFRAGASARVTDRFTLAADVSLQGTLTAERDTIDGEPLIRKHEMPTAFGGGASFRLGDRVLLTGGGGWTGWSGSEGASGQYTASDVTWMGIGAELSDTRLLGANFPIRVGLRQTDLPFHERGTDQLTERALTLGFGMRVADEQARVDIGFEIGKRGDLQDSGVEEGFRRLSLSLALFQD